MDYAKLKQIEVEGKLFDVYVSDYRGEFSAVPAGLPPGHPNTLASDWVYEKILPALKKRVKEAATRVEVPFCTINGEVLRMGVARGIHGSKGTVLVTWSNGEKGELQRHERSTYAVPPQEVIEKATALAATAATKREELLAAEKALEAVLQPYAMNPKGYGYGHDKVPTLGERVQAAITATISRESA